MEGSRRQNKTPKLERVWGAGSWGVALSGLTLARPRPTRMTCWVTLDDCLFLPTIGPRLLVPLFLLVLD